MVPYKSYEDFTRSSSSTSQQRRLRPSNSQPCYVSCTFYTPICVPVSPKECKELLKKLETKSQPDMEYNCINKNQETTCSSDKNTERERSLRMESMLKKVLIENQQLKTAVLLLKEQSKDKEPGDECKSSAKRMNHQGGARREEVAVPAYKEKLLSEIGSLLTEIAFLKEVREQLRYKDPECRKDTTKALTDTIQAKLEVAHAKIEAAEAKKETLEAHRRAEAAKETAEAAQAREDNLLAYVSKIATLAYQQAAEAEYDCAQARKAMAIAEAAKVAALADGKIRRCNKHQHHQEKHRQNHRSHGECRCHHNHHSHHEHRGHLETTSDLLHSDPETLSSGR